MWPVSSWRAAWEGWERSVWGPPAGSGSGSGRPSGSVRASGGQDLLSTKQLEQRRFDRLAGLCAVVPLLVSAARLSGRAPSSALFVLSGAALAFAVLVAWPALCPSAYCRHRCLVVAGLRLVSFLFPVLYSVEPFDAIAPGPSSLPFVGWLVDGFLAAFGEGGGAEGRAGLCAEGRGQAAVGSRCVSEGCHL